MLLNSCSKYKHANIFILTLYILGSNFSYIVEFYEPILYDITPTSLFLVMNHLGLD